jgi:hypothetical protein
MLVGELAEDVAEDAAAARRRDREVDLVEVHDEPEQLHVQRAEDEIEHLTGGFAWLAIVCGTSRARVLSARMGWRARRALIAFAARTFVFAPARLQNSLPRTPRATPASGRGAFNPAA